LHIGTRLETRGGEKGIGANAITPPPVLNRNSSGDEILGLLPQAPRRTARREANDEGHDPSARDSGARTNELLAMDFDHEEVQRGARPASAADAVALGVNATAQLEPEHLRRRLWMRSRREVSMSVWAMARRQDSALTPVASRWMPPRNTR
jgi:hypothetical protein